MIATAQLMATAQLCTALDRMVEANVCNMRQTTIDTFFMQQDAASSPVVLSEAQDACSSNEDRMDIL